MFRILFHYNINPKRVVWEPLSIPVTFSEHLQGQNYVCSNIMKYYLFSVPFSLCDILIDSATAIVEKRASKFAQNKATVPKCTSIVTVLLP